VIVETVNLTPRIQKCTETAQRTKHLFSPSIISKFPHFGEMNQISATGNENIELDVIGSVIENHHEGQHQIARNLNISQVLKKHNNYHDYKIKLQQELSMNDYVNRIEFCMWVLEKGAENENFVNLVLFSDECTFHNNRSVNRRNFYYYYCDLNAQDENNS